MNQTKPTQLSHKKPNNFAEALLELGGQNIQRENALNKPQQTQETEWKDYLRGQRHQEVINTQVFSREQEQVEQKIKEIQEELIKLAEEIVMLGSQIDRAIHENIVEPGTYHLNFLDSLKKYLIQLRKKTAESRDWLAVSQQRKQDQNHYWGAVKKSGTSFMLSNERTTATQTG